SMLYIGTSLSERATSTQQLRMTSALDQYWATPPLSPTPMANILVLPRTLLGMGLSTITSSITHPHGRRGLSFNVLPTLIGNDSSNPVRTCVPMLTMRTL